MKYVEIPPIPEITDLVECYWTNSFDRGDLKNNFDLIIPDGCADIVFMLSGSYERKELNNKNSELIQNCKLVMPFKKCVKVHQTENTRIFSIRLKPGAIFKLTNVSLNEFNKSCYSLDILFRDLGDLLMNSINSRNNLEDLVRLANSWFSKQKLRPYDCREVWLFIKTSISKMGKLEIMDFCASIDIHKSTLEKKFKQLSGLTPKQFLKIIRFNYLLKSLYTSSSNLTELAYDLNYYDQSHMIKEFKYFTGLTPSSFLEYNFTVPKVAAQSIKNRNLIYQNKY